MKRKVNSARNAAGSIGRRSPSMASQAMRSEPNARRPPEQEYKNGFSPNRSRAAKRVRLPASQMAKANMPMSRDSRPSPHCCQPAKMTSVSECERNA